MDETGGVLNSVLSRVIANANPIALGSSEEERTLSGTSGLSIDIHCHMSIAS